MFRIAPNLKHLGTPCWHTRLPYFMNIAQQICRYETDKLPAWRILVF